MMELHQEYYGYKVLLDDHYQPDLKTLWQIINLMVVGGKLSQRKLILTIADWVVASKYFTYGFEEVKTLHHLMNSRIIFSSYDNRTKYS